jgi:succinyl-CoA synthetase beta subunit
MRLHEFEGKALFAQHGIAVPKGQVVYTSDEAVQVAKTLGGSVAVKAQVLVGGRGRHGGIWLVDSAEAAGVATGEIMASDIRGEQPAGVLIEERLSIVQEVYLGITVDGAVGRPAVVVSAKGGVSIEDVAKEHPEAVVMAHMNPFEGLALDQAYDLSEKAGVLSAPAVGEVLYRLCQVFVSCEAIIAEINPLAVLSDGRVVAADAVVELDDAALFRHPEFKTRAEARFADPTEKQAKSLGMTFVKLDGDIGLICSGAGLGMATMDLICERARPANFLETGGGITRDLLAQAMRLVLDQPHLKGVLINLYGGINPIHEGALGIADVMAEGVSVPVVAKALGNFEEQTWATLSAAGVTVVKAVETEKAVAEMWRRL